MYMCIAVIICLGGGANINNIPFRTSVAIPVTFKIFAHKPKLLINLLHRINVCNRQLTTVSIVGEQWLSSIRQVRLKHISKILFLTHST